MKYEYTMRSNDDFAVSAMVWHELYPKLKLGLFQSLLCKHLKIKDYSEIVKHYYFVFIVMQKLVPQETHRFQTKTGFLLNSLIMDYDKFAQADEAQAMQMQAELYLEGIKYIPKSWGMKKRPFDWQKFYTDVRNLFVEQGWIKEN